MTGTAYGIITALTNVFAVIGPVITGLIIDFEDNEPTESKNDKYTWVPPY